MQVNRNEYIFLGMENDIKQMIRTLVFRRKEIGMTQRELASMVGIKQSALARIESMKIYPNLKTIVLISRALDLQVFFKRLSTGWKQFEIPNDSK